MRINVRTVERRGLGVLFLVLVAGLLYLSILFYAHAFTKTSAVTLYAGCQADPQSGTGAPAAPSTGVTEAAAAAGTGTVTGAARDVQDAAAVGAPMKSATEDPASCTVADSQDQNAGHSLDVPADVKLRGIEVGTVSKISSNGNGAIVTLKLQPSKLKDIPKDVTAEIIPKTLFGEKYVSLVIPDSEPQGSARIHAGDAIYQSTTAIEAEQVFDDLLPLLNTLDPVDLSTTLTNLSQALQGRGNELGDNLARTDTYLSQLNPDLGNVQTDISGLETLATNLHAATPDLLASARQFSTNARTLVAKGDVFASFLLGSQGFADTATRILTTNEANITALAVDNQPTLQVLATYSPEYPCLLQGFVKDEGLLSQAFTPRGSKGTDDVAGLHLNLTVDPNALQAPAYSSATTVPVYDPKTGQATGTAGPFNAQYDDGILDDNRAYPNPGSLDLPVEDNPDGSSNGSVSGPCFGMPGTTLPEPLGLTPPVNSKDPTFQRAGSANAATSASATSSNASSMALAKILAAPDLGVTSSSVSDLAAILVAPQIRGNTVGVTQ